MSTEALAVVEQLWEELSVDDVVAGLADPVLDRRVRAMFAEVADRDFRVTMRAPADVGGTTFEGAGPDGFRAVWQEWSGVFASFRIEPRERFVEGDQVAEVVRLIATSKVGGAPIEQDAGVVWSFRDGKLAGADFYLGPDDALRAAGIDPDRSKGE